MKAKAVIVIPARYGSTRFSGKPLAVISGKSMLERVWRLASQVKNVETVLIATDDERIQKHAEEFGAQAVLTSPSCSNGSERAFAAVQRMTERPEIIVNFQGDSPLTPPQVLESLVTVMQENDTVQVATPAVLLSPKELTEAKAGVGRGGTYVTFNLQHQALYFSKALIPYQREQEKERRVFRHIGIYAYRYQALQRYLTLQSTPLEETEKLEQLRLLEHGVPIQIVEVSLQGRSYWSVDQPQDIQIVEKIIRREGELII